MNLADLLKKNIVMVPVVASVLVGTFTGVKYIVGLTDTINSNQQEIISLQKDLKVAENKIVDQNLLSAVVILSVFSAIVTPLILNTVNYYVRKPKQ